MMTIDRVIGLARQRQGLAQPDDVLARWIIHQEERLFDTTVKAHGLPRPATPNGALWPISPWGPGWNWCGPAEAEDSSAEDNSAALEFDIVREYPQDDEVPLLMDGSYSEAYIYNLFAMSAYDDGDISRYNLFSAKANDTEQAWRNRYFREHRGYGNARLEWKNE
jgi:hypothetical protein